MLKFFRRIRQNLLSEGKSRKYFKYAAGEIVLVVIGILIALQINNWNEGQKAHSAKKEKYAAVILDLHRDLIRQMRIYYSCSWRLEMVHELADVLSDDTISRDQKNYSYLIYTLDYYSYVKENHKHLTGEISNKAINDKLARYLYYQYGVDQSLAACNDLIKELRAYFTKNGVLDLKTAVSFEKAYTVDPEKQLVNTRKLLEHISDEAFQGHLTMLKTLSQRVREKMSGLMKANNELQYLLAKFIEKPFEHKVGVVGTALPGGWDQLVPLTQVDDYENIWEGTLDLRDGEIKFQRENEPEDFNWGEDKINGGRINPLGAAISVNKGRYLIRVNLNDLTFNLTKQ